MAREVGGGPSRFDGLAALWPTQEDVEVERLSFAGDPRTAGSPDRFPVRLLVPIAPADTRPDLGLTGDFWSVLTESAA